MIFSFRPKLMLSAALSEAMSKGATFNGVLSGIRAYYKPYGEYRGTPPSDVNPTIRSSER